MLDDRGVDFLGMRLIVVLVAAVMLLSIGAAFVDDRVNAVSKERARQECRRVASLAETEYVTGGSDDGALILINIPRNVRRATFGTDSPRAYGIEFTDGTVETYAAECRFAPAIVYPGEHRLEINTISDNGTYTIGLREAS